MPHYRCPREMLQLDTGDFNASEAFSGIYYFEFCWAYACLPEALQDVPLNITAEAVEVPNGGFNVTENATAVVLDVIGPACTLPSALVSVNDNQGSDLVLPANMGDGGLLEVAPSQGSTVTALSCSTAINTTCDNSNMMVLMTTAFIQEPQPIVPTSSCPCWAPPDGNGTCPFPQIPITLETVTANASLGASYQQCIDPANFDFYRGEMAFSFCWRYKCLPDAFSKSNFTATVPGLERFNIPDMPGGVVYNATIKATPGVVLSVSGPPKDAAEQGVSFTNGPEETRPSLALINRGDWTTMNVTLPQRGWSNATFTFFVPMSYDDLSAAVTMILWEGQDLPAAPPPPVGTVCACPAEVEDDGTCSQGLMLARYTRRDDPSRNTTRCLAPPQFDIFRVPPRFVFSLCWLWECFGPDFRGPDSSRIKPYTIVLPNVTAFHNIERMLPGSATLELRKPLEVNMTVSIRAGEEETGPFWENDELITLPGSQRGDISSLAITIEVPPQPWYDNNAAALIIKPGPFPSPPPLPPTLPPLPPLSPGSGIDSATSFIVARYTVLEELSSEDLDSLLMRPSADIVAEITQLIVLLPTAFSDLLAIPSCAPDALDSLKATLAEIWGIDKSMVVDLQCSMGGTVTQRRRQLLDAPTTGPARRLLQAATDPCNAGAMICLDIQLALPYSDAFNANEDGREGLVSSFHAQMESNQQMKDSLHGFGQAIFATRFKISQPDWQDQQPSDVPGRQLTQGDSTPPDCSGLDATLPRRLRDELISDPECERELVQLPDDGTPPGPDPGESNPPGDEGGDVITDQPEDEDPSSGSSDGNLGMILGLALGLGLGITALVGVLYLVVRARRLKEKTVLAAAQRVGPHGFRKPRTITPEPSVLAQHEVRPPPSIVNGPRRTFGGPDSTASTAERMQQQQRQQQRNPMFKGWQPRQR